MEHIYKLENVTKIYGNGSNKHKALKEINLKIKIGDVVVILGPSGSGKSTLLNILSGIDKPSSGKVIFETSRIDKMTDQELTDYRREEVGFIFQSYNLIPNLTVKENVELGSNLSKEKVDILEILSTVGLGDHVEKYPYQLSGGQMQRVSIARALAKNSKILFCDEPTGALDEKTGKAVLEMLQKINKKYKTTIIIVTHNPSIANMAHHVIKMNSGEIVSEIYNEKIVNAKDLGWA